MTGYQTQPYNIATEQFSPCNVEYYFCKSLVWLGRDTSPLPPTPEACTHTHSAKDSGMFQQREMIVMPLASSQNMQWGRLQTMSDTFPMTEHVGSTLVLWRFECITRAYSYSASFLNGDAVVLSVRPEWLSCHITHSEETCPSEAHVLPAVATHTEQPCDT